MAKQNSVNNFVQELTVDPGSSGDSFVQFNINATGEFRIGVDDDASDAFKISQGSALGTNDTFVMTAAGERTMPLQPAFLALVATTIVNVTGDGTAYTVVYDTEVFDQGGDFDGTSTFTAPVTGKYRLEACTTFSELTGSVTNGYLNMVTSNRGYFTQYGVGVSRDSVSNRAPVYATSLCDMDATDTAVISSQCVGITKVVDVFSAGATDPRTWFSGNLEV